MSKIVIFWDEEINEKMEMYFEELADGMEQAAVEAITGAPADVVEVIEVDEYYKYKRGLLVNQYNEETPEDERQPIDHFTIGQLNDLLY